MIEIIKEIHNNENTALIIENYPYGFRLKTKIKYWIETDKKKGDRFVSQTLNPKTNKWNNPKKSVYNSVMVLTRDNENGHISYIGLYPTTDKERINRFIEKTNGFNFFDEQKEQLRILRAYSKTYENVTFEIKEVTNQTEEEKLKHDNEQAEIKKDINRLASYNYRKDTNEVKTI